MLRQSLFASLRRQLREASGSAHDELKLDMALRDAFELWRVLFEQAREGMVVLDDAGQVREVNQAFADMLGYSKQEMLQLSTWDWDAQYQRDELLEMLAQVDDEGAWLETRHRRKDGTIIDVDLSNNGATYKGQKLVFCVCRDITECKREQAKLERMARTDVLTGLFNRHAFLTELNGEIDRVYRYHQPLSVLMYDLDHFKRINDTYGHDAGDAVLQTVSELVSQHVRGADVVARWGGEEFIILLPETDCGQAASVAEKLRHMIASHPFEQVGSVTSSFGVTAFVHGESMDELLKRVDEALYAAKAQGRNRVETRSGNPVDQTPRA